MTTKQPIPNFDQHLHQVTSQVVLGIFNVHKRNQGTEAQHNAMHGLYSFKIYDASPDTFTQVHLNGHKLYKIKSTDFCDIEDKQLLEIIHDALNRDSFKEQVDKVLRHPA